MSENKKSVLVAGASSGIGKACVERFASSGYTVVMVARNEEKMKAIIKDFGENCIAFQYDLFEIENIKSIFEFVKERGIKLDGMVYSAGMLAECPVKANQVSLLEKSIRLHCVSFYEMSKYYYSRKYSNNNSTIVAISSISSLLCEKGMGPYSVAKAGLDAAVRTMAKEFLNRQIRVNAILPAGVETPMAQMKRDRDGVTDEHKADGQPLGVITPDSIASLAQYLMGDDARFITGALIPVSAGMNV